MNIWSKLPQPFLCLAPMEGITDIVFRQVIARAHRPDLFFTEFTNVSSYASDKGRANALTRLAIAPSDPPLIAQIWGKDPSHFATTCAALANLGFAGIDINMGCPDRHVNRAGGGAAMIQHPNLAQQCIESAHQSSTLPISVKTRLGYTTTTEMTAWISFLLKQNLAALTIHLRTRKEMSKVPAHFELIPDLITLRDQIAPQTKLIINGDITNLAHAKQLAQQHPQINGFMIGRGVLTNPYCFSNHQPTSSELLDLLSLHLDLHDQAAKQTPRKFDPLKHYFKIYIRDFNGASQLRTQLMACHDTATAREILTNFRKSASY